MVKIGKFVGNFLNKAVGNNIGHETDLVSCGVHVKCLVECHLHSFPLPPTKVNMQSELSSLNQIYQDRFRSIFEIGPYRGTRKAEKKEKNGRRPILYNFNA